MRLNLEKHLADGYKSSSQKARVLTEHWVGKTAFCPGCGHLELSKYPNNKPAADFYCSNCEDIYELKSKKSGITGKVSDGEYNVKMARLQGNTHPNLFLLNYDAKKYRVLNFLVVPKHFFAPEIVEKRKPLSSHARRAGWVGSNILVRKIPNAGKIFLVKNQAVRQRGKVLAEWKKTLFLCTKALSARGWMLDVMRCIDDLGKRDFTLDDAYSFENELRKLHPDNRNIRPKIRQQLQFLRDKGYLSFKSRGRYRLL